jgi:Tol biopolymer transport system component
MTPITFLKDIFQDSFEQKVWAVIVSLILAIIGVTVAGNNVGVRVESYTPDPYARGDSRIHIRFYEEMQPQTVEQRFNVRPAMKGSFRWNGPRELVFEPQGTWVSGEVYTVTVQAGAVNQAQSAELNEDFTFQFQVEQPKIIYLAPASTQQRNLTLYDLNTGQSRPLTDTEWGIADYAVGPDGNQIAYTLYKDDGTSDIWVYGLASGSSTQFTNCVNSSCGAPDWDPDGTQIAYEREEYDSAFGQLGARRVWRVNLSNAQSSLLFEDTQVTGHSPTFSPDGEKVAIFATNPPGILIYDFAADSRLFIESLQGVVGTFSPDSTKMVYPILVRGAIGTQFYTQLEAVDLLAQQRSNITGPAAETPIEDSNGVWRPGYPTQMAVSRRYFDDRITDGAQVYLLNTETYEATPLVVDPDYTQGALAWSPDGNLLVMQRFNRTQQGARPEIWLYNMQTEELNLIAVDAFLPGFIP